jgi:AAA15 family ATPase/GTPase
VGLNEELIARIQVPPGSDCAKIVYLNFLHPLLTSEKEEIKKALEKVLDEEGSKVFDYERIEDFKVLIHEFSAKPELWLDQKVLSPDKYKKLSEITKKAKEYHKEFNEEFIKLLKKCSKLPDGKEAQEKYNKELINELNKKTKPLKSKYGIQGYDFYAAFAPYDFLFFCLDQLGLKSTIGDLDIGIGKGEGDALPEFDNNYGLKIEIDSSDSDKILNYDDFFIDEAIRSAISQIVVGPGQILRDELKKLHYLGPIRSRIPRDYVPNRFIEDLNWANGRAAWDVLHKEDKKFIRQVDNWLADRLKSGYRMIRKSYKEIDASEVESGNANSEKIVQQFNSAPTKTRLFLKDEKNGVEVQPPDVGTGISQVLPVIVSALYFKEGMVEIEQPELHIHPAFQTILGDLFISQAQKKELIFLLETHSEHLLLRLLRRIRETNDNQLEDGAQGLTPKKLGVYYVENSATGVQISKLEVDEIGEFKDEWPDGFFEEREKELFY